VLDVEGEFGVDLVDDALSSELGDAAALLGAEQVSGTSQLHVEPRDPEARLTPTCGSDGETALAVPV